jgi:cytochrome P450
VDGGADRPGQPDHARLGQSPESPVAAARRQLRFHAARRAARAGRFYDLTFDLQPDDQVIPAGKRIGLMIFSSDRDFTLWPKPGTELTVDLDRTSLRLPIVGGAAALR